MTEKRLDLIDALTQILNDAEITHEATISNRFQWPRGIFTVPDLADSIEGLKEVFRDIGIQDSFVRSMGYDKLISLALEKTA